MATVTIKAGNKTFSSVREYIIWEAKGCIAEGFSWEMYVSYMTQYDPDGSKGFIFDEAGYLLIKTLGDKAE